MYQGRRLKELERGIQFVCWASNEEMSIYYRKASVLPIPSWWAEAFGIVGIEAMSNSRPVVAFRTGGIPDWLGDQETGYLVERGDIKGLADKISLLLDQEDLV